MRISTTLTEWSQPDLFVQPVFSWDSTNVDRLRQLVAEGQSCRHIAAELGCTRNAVIGKIHRLGIVIPNLPGSTRKLGRPKKPKELHWTGFPKRKSPTRKPPIIPDDYQSVELECIPVEQRKSLLELTDQTCRWPIGHPGEPGFYFCGGNAVPGLPYCGGHARLAYAAPKVRSPSIAPREAAA